jgi:hypothetical protein
MSLAVVSIFELDQRFSPKTEYILVSMFEQCVGSAAHNVAGTAFRDIKIDRLYPSVGMKKSGELLYANFGEKPFVFDIDGMMRVSGLHFLSQQSEQRFVLTPNV